jgi:hypothetical protein
MKLSFPVYCSACREWFEQRVSGNDFPGTTSCPLCDASIGLVAPLGNVVGMAILGRAAAELKEQDWTLAIVLSAMGIECQLAYLFMKWNRVDLIRTRNPNDADEQLWEKQWRDEIRSIKARLEKVSSQLTNVSFDAFCSQHTSLLTGLHTKFPVSQNGSLKEFFIENFFHKRNRIVHFGEINYQQADAELCFTSAMTLWRVLEGMDKQRQQALMAT